MGVEARFRATEQRLAAANGLDVQERQVDIASPPGRVRVLEAGAGDPVVFLNGISAPGIGMAALAGRLPGHQVLLVDLPGRRARRLDDGRAHRAGARSRRNGDGRLPLPRFLGRMGLRNAVGADGARSLSDDIVDLHLLSGRLPGQFASYRSLLRHLLVGLTPRPENILSDAELASFTVPLLFVWPEDDKFLPPAAGKPSVDKIPTARFVTTPGGLFAWYDDPERCAALVAGGLQPVGPTTDFDGRDPLGA